MKTKHKTLKLILLLIFIVEWSEEATTNEWKKRSIYQLLTDRFALEKGKTMECKGLEEYCGGTWISILQNLDYIEGMGFDAIWISPIVSNTKNGYHGYWAKDFSRLNSHFGSSQDLINLSKECKRRGMYFMVDVVANHMGDDSISNLFPFNQQEHFHDCLKCPSHCWITDWSNQTEVEDCQLFGLPDLNQTVPFVRDYLNNWVRNIVKKYEIDGLRVDTVPEVEKSFWGSYQQSANVFLVGEVSFEDINYVSQYQTPIGPLASLLSYPLYYVLRNVFAKGGKMQLLSEMNALYREKMGDVNVLGSFVDNHDHPRFLFENNDTRLYKAALAYNFFASGIPILYYGSEQNFHGGEDPHCREPLWISGYNTSSDLYQFIAKLNRIRKRVQIWNSDQNERLVSDHIYSFSRGRTLVIVSNDLFMQKQKITNHPFSNGERICNILLENECTIVKNGSFYVTIRDAEPKIFHPIDSVPSKNH